MRIGIITDMVTADFSSKKYQFVVGLPPYAKVLVNSRNKSKIPPPVPFLGTVMLATVLKEKGYKDIHILDFYAEPSKAKKELEKGNFDLLGLHTTFMDKNKIIEISKLCRKYNSKAIILAGGPEAVNYKKELIKKKIFDYVIIGEGEQTLLEIVKVIEKNKVISNVTGVYNGKRYHKRKPIKDLNKLPFPDWSLINLNAYLPVLPVQTIRGCPHSCLYCTEWKFWEKPIRLRSEEKVVEEIKQDINAYGIKTFRFVDSTFTFPPKRTKRICDLIIKENLDIKWTSYARAEDISEELVQSMAKSGCIAVDIGAESGSAIILKNMNKMQSPANIKNAIYMLKKYDIFVHANFMVGFPGETKKTIRETIKLIKEDKPTTFCFNPLIIIPGTELWLKRRKYGITGELEEWQHKTMTSIEVQRIIHEIYNKEFSKSKDNFYFFGGEHAANNIVSLGYNKNDVKDIYRSFNDLCIHSKPWVMFQAILSKFNMGRLNTFFHSINDLKKYGEIYSVAK